MKFEIRKEEKGATILDMDVKMLILSILLYLLGWMAKPTVVLYNEPLTLQIFEGWFMWVVFSLAGLFVLSKYTFSYAFELKEPVDAI